MKKIIRENQWQFLLNLILKLVKSILAAYAGYSLSYIIDVFNKTNVTTTDLIKLFLMILFVWTLSIACSFFTGLHQNYLLKKIRVDLSSHIADAIIRKPIEEINFEDKGTYLSWLINDVKEIAQKTFLALLATIEAIFSIVTSFVTIVLLGWPIAIAAVLLSFLVLTIPQLLNDRMQNVTRIVTRSKETLTSNLKDILNGLVLLVSNNKNDIFRTKVIEACTNYENDAKKYNDTMAGVATINGYSSFLSQFILLGVASISILNGYSSTGALLGVGNLSGTFFSNVGTFIQNYMIYKSAKIIWDKYDSEYEVSYKEILENNINFISTNNLSFTYSIDNARIDKKVNDKLQYPDLNIEIGKKYLLVGENGSGKSTLLKLLSAFYDLYEGKLLLNNKFEIKDVDKNKLWEQVSYMFQEPYIFNDNIKNNISLWDETVSDKEIIDVIEKVNLTDFIQTKEQGLEYVIEENGKNLSGGQKQRIILARTLLQNKRFIFVDEATSNIDKASKEIILENLLSLENTCVIIVDHNISESEFGKFDTVIKI